jgi:hypothetical protein
MTPPVVAPVPVVIEAVQYTPDREPVVVHYRARDAIAGPLATTNLFHTTQPELAARGTAAARAGEAWYWSCDEVKAALADHLAEHGFAVSVVANVLQQPEPVPESAVGSLSEPPVSAAPSGGTP